MKVFKINPGSGERLGLLATATVGEAAGRRMIYEMPRRALAGSGDDRRRKRAYLFAVAVWLGFRILAFGLGAVRELLLAPAIGEQAAHVVGTLAFVGVMLGVTAVFVRRIRPGCPLADLWLVGLLWLVLTVAFELLFFHFVAGKPWEILLADYNVLRGRIGVLVPLTELFGPPVIGWLMRRSFRAPGVENRRLVK